MTDGVMDRVVDIGNDEEGEKKATFHSVMRNLALMGGCVQRYKRRNSGGWTDEYCRKTINEAMENITRVLKKLDIVKLPTEELIELGFRWWGKVPDQKDKSLLLIPIYALPAIPDGTELTSIGGEVEVVGTDEIDDDVRMGLIPYGFIREKKDEPEEEDDGYFQKKDG